MNDQEKEKRLLMEPRIRCFYIVCEPYFKRTSKRTSHDNSAVELIALKINVN